MDHLRLLRNPSKKFKKTMSKDNSVGVDSNYRDVDFNRHSVNYYNNYHDVNNIVDEDDDDDQRRWPGHGRCPQCKKANHSPAWCNTCDRKALVDKFHDWSTGDKDLDLLIQKTQRTATNYNWRGYLEYVPYDRFSDVKSLDGSVADRAFTAQWLDGERKVDYEQKVKLRSGPCTVILKSIDNNDHERRIKSHSKPFTVVLKTIKNSIKMKQSIVNRLKSYYQFYRTNINTFPVPECYGITRDPETTNYTLILKYLPDDDSRTSLTTNPNNNSNKLNLASPSSCYEKNCCGDKILDPPNQNLISLST